MAARAWRASVAEAPVVAELLVGFRDHMGRDRPGFDALLAGISRLIEQEDTEYLLAAAGADAPAAGVCQLRFRHGIWLEAPDCWLEYLYVEERSRREGVGRALVQAALDRAGARGCRRVELDVSDANSGALALYERFGFRTGKEPGTRDLLMSVRLDRRREAGRPGGKLGR